MLGLGVHGDGASLSLARRKGGRSSPPEGQAETPSVSPREETNRGDVTPESATTAGVCGERPVCYGVLLDCVGAEPEGQAVHARAGGGLPAACGSFPPSMMFI
jgi:hypothetical protein